MTTANHLIFVSIAAYRDPQLVPTVLDCIAKAVDSDELRFGICWQRDAAEPELPFRDDPRFRILEVDWRESKGACWARAEIMKLWQGEDWFLQVDSHCRFARQWDAKMLRAVMQTGSERPVLSTYATPFTPSDDEELAEWPLQIAFQAFTAEGIPQLKPAELPRTGPPARPMRARFLAGGFLFAPGRFVEDVPYDPELYFMGEESSMTVRAFTHGYDLFHPAEPIVWHDYLRHDSRKHWGDHNESNHAERPWTALDERSRRKVQRMLLGEPVESFGPGTERTIADYEAYAGLSFRLRKAQQYTVRRLEPPNPEPEPDWAEKIHPWIAKVMIERAALPAGALDDPALWYVAIQDAEGYEISRRDFSPAELEPLTTEHAVALAQGEAAPTARDIALSDIALICEFPSESAPVSWSLWPLSRSKGWLKKISGTLGEEDFALLEEDDDAPEQGE